MIDLRPIAKRTLLGALFITLLAFGQTAQAQDGAQLFADKCATCHKPDVDLTGPALKGIEERVKDKEALYAWIRNPQKVLASGNKYFNDLYIQWNKVPMNANPQLTDEEIAAILSYVEAYQPKSKGPTGGTGVQVEEKDNSILYGVLTLILAVIALVMLQVNSSLKRLADEKEGLPAGEPVPFYLNKTYIALFAIILFIVGGFLLTKGLIGLGRQQDYQPDQPIFYSHKVHAGVNQINCLYCHGGAMEGKHANIPSLNVCMNCHTTITSYNGDPLYREDGSEVDGTAEIQKIYEAVGYDPTTKQYTGNGKGIEWVQIHSLPDHVYFNHSQHVAVGGVQCQTCHGDIQNMDVVKQFSDLSMGWCVNCHRETKVNFGGENGEGNKFYSLYEKFHNEIKEGKRDSVTVADIGGTECQKCHY